MPVAVETFLETPKTVSYTHLDVYKRQLLHTLQNVYLDCAVRETDAEEL